MAAPSPAPSAVLRRAPPTAWLLAAYAAGVVCDAAYCWQNAWSAANASKLRFGPGATGIVGPNGGAAHAPHATSPAPPAPTPPPTRPLPPPPPQPQPLL